jgi:hypothetical protein
MRLSEASRAQRAAVLGKHGLTTEFVLLDLQDAARADPALENELARCKSDDEREQLAFEWFEEHAQPAERSNWHVSPVYSLGDDSEPTYRTPDWPGGRLPRLEDDAPVDDKRGAKELGIPEAELWWIIERRLENGSRASRKWLALETKRRENLTYVPRDRLTPLVDWIDLHPDAARQAAALRRIPPEFRAGQLGPIPPRA